MLLVFFFKQKTAYEMRISDWSSDVCSSDLLEGGELAGAVGVAGFEGLEQVHRDVGDLHGLLGAGALHAAVDHDVVERAGGVDAAGAGGDELLGPLVGDLLAGGFLLPNRGDTGAPTQPPASLGPGSHQTVRTSVRT